ncbi:GNAT family N-acetyltransferase [Streptomyces sp. BI20]|uniref:GNAT family N-acetyltransferase n=1 Tax=Streptomyces sp. BI20 TaxID=3403460 RepID=UPI003C7488FF
MTHDVVVNAAGRYSTWPIGRELPAGWRPTGFRGGERDCLEHLGAARTEAIPGGADPADAPPGNTLVTGRLTLRELTPYEVAGLLDEGARSAGWVADYPLAGTKYPAGGFGRRTPGQLLPGFGMYHLVRSHDGLVIGEMGFHAPPRDGAVEVGFGLAESCRGVGHAGEALTALTRWALDRPDVERIVGRALVSNTPSRRVLLRAGFVHESRDTDVDRFVLTR